MVSRTLRPMNCAVCESADASSAASGTSSSCVTAVSASTASPRALVQPSGMTVMCSAAWSVRREAKNTPAYRRGRRTVRSVVDEGGE